MEPVYKKVTDAAGNVSFVEVEPQLAITHVPVPPAPTAEIVSTAIGAAGSWIADRAGETNTHIGAIGGAIAAPTIADNAGKALVAGLAGDYVSCALFGVPALLGMFGSLAAMITPEKPKGVSDDQIKTAVSRLSRDELVGLLRQPVNAVSPVQTAAGGVHG